jgi:hemoglobin-like flavoprotein
MLRRKLNWCKQKQMTQEQISLIKKSWRLFRQIDPHLVGGVFYDKLFSEHPSLRRMFKTSIEVQSQKLLDMLSAIVMHLDRLDELTGDIEALAIRHVHYGVKPEHYKAVGAALLWTFQQGLGVDWTEEVEEAWLTCYTHLSTTMISAAYSV